MSKPQLSVLAGELLDEDIRFLDPRRTGQANRVYRGLREAITAGHIPSRALLRSSQDLEPGYKVDQAVVAAALRGLVRDGLVHLHHLGARVVDDPSPNAEPASQRPPLTAPELVERSMRQRLADGVYQPGKLLPVQATLAEEFGMRVPAFRRTISPLYREGYVAASVKPKGTLVTPRVLEVPRDQLLAVRAPRQNQRRQLHAAFGESKTLSDWSKDERCAVAFSVLRSRVIENGWALERAVSTPLLR